MAASCYESGGRDSAWTKKKACTAWRNGTDYRGMTQPTSRETQRLQMEGTGTGRWCAEQKREQPWLSDESMGEDGYCHDETTETRKGELTRALQGGSIWNIKKGLSLISKGDINSGPSSVSRLGNSRTK